MYCRLCLLLIFLLAPLAVLADGCAYGYGFSLYLMESCQIAVVKLTETSADVSMFIAIDGIPAGKQLTYILPFWYRPEGFSLAEDGQASFWEKNIYPATDRLQRLRLIAHHYGTRKLLETAILAPLLLPLFPWANGNPASSAALTPYATKETAHARVELYRIGEGDLQQLLRQSGLPEQYLKPLRKYRTPYFAVMHLTSMTSNEMKKGITGRSVSYHFTHRISGGRYTYPLGTGAAWPQPIPITEVYFTCPDRLSMQVKAPVEGKVERKEYFESNTMDLMRYYERSPEERKKDHFPSCTSSLLTAEFKNLSDYLSPYTSSQFAVDINKRSSAWHIAYLQSNPAEDICVQLSRRPAPWRIAFAEFFSSQFHAYAVCLSLYLLSWCTIGWFFVRQRWQRAGKQGKLFVLILSTFIKSLCLYAILAAMLYELLNWCETI